MDGKIDMPYFKTLIDLQQQKYRISTWLYKTSENKYIANYNLTKCVAEAFQKVEIIKQLGTETEQKLHDTWLATFSNHSLSFAHWYDIHVH